MVVQLPITEEELMTDNVVEKVKAVLIRYLD